MLKVSPQDKEKLIDVGGVNSMTAIALDEITVELVQARRKRTEAETVYRQVATLKGQPMEAFESIPAVLKNAGLISGIKRSKKVILRD